MDFAQRFERVLSGEVQGDIVCSDCLDVMAALPDGCVDLVVTSPPYFNEMEYSTWPSYMAYLKDMRRVVRELARVIRPGHRVIVNVADIYSKSGFVTALSADWHRLLRDYLNLDTTIVWDKTLKSAANTAWGSWCLPSNPCIQSYHEYILVYRRAGKRRIPPEPHRQQSIMDRNFFLEHIRSVWQFRQDTDFDRSLHPAVFPIALPEKCIRLWSFVSEVIFDPFIGPGTTAMAAASLGRKLFGCDINPDYVKMSLDRIKQDRLRRSQLTLL